MNWKLLSTLMTLVCVVTSVALGQGTSTTILQGNYITNVFGNSNFVLNPNAQTNVANVAVSNATVTRSTTTPLVATTEFLITTSTATGYADWSLRTFDQGMKGQNCEARFTYRGFSVGTTTAQIHQGTNVVAQLALTASTDPRIASINFPCGDLSAVTKFRLQQATASLTGTNEIGGIYVGLATNMANVAQAEMVGTVTFNNGSAGKQGITSTWTEFDAGTWTPTVIGQGTGSNKLQIAFSYLPAGRYYVNAVINPVVYGGTATNHGCRFGIQETTSGTVFAIKDNAATPANIYKTLFAPINGNFDFTTGAARTFRIVVNGDGYSQSASGNCFAEQTGDNAKVQLAVYRFPSSSELVVTPERQNVFGGVKFTGGSSTLFNAVAPSTTFANYTDATNWKPTSAGGTGTYYGKATSTTTTGELGLKIPNMPAGTYRMTVRGNVFPDASAGASGQYTACTIELYETTTAAGFAKNYQFTGHGAAATIPGPGDFSGQLLMDGIFANTSVADRNFIVRAQKLYDSTAGNVGKCLSTTFNSDIVITIQPLDQPSNSALYVQGPVLASQTGAAIPAGYVGEVVEQTTATTSTTTVTADTEVDVTNANITLGVGVWELQYSADVTANRTPAGTVAVYGRIRVTDSANTNEAGMESFFGNFTNTSSQLETWLTATKTKRILITSGTKTYKLRITCSQSVAAGVCGAYNGGITGGISGNDGTTYIRAVRVN